MRREKKKANKKKLGKERKKKNPKQEEEKKLQNKRDIHKTPFLFLKNSQKRQDKRRAPKIYKKTCQVPPRSSHSDAIFFPH